MNGQQASDQARQASQESRLAYLLSSGGGGGPGAAGLFGYPGGLSAAQRLGFGGGSDAAALEEQILQRASALRAEALLQQQQQQHHQQAQQRQHHLGAALAALQQQQQLSALGINPNHLAGLSVQEQELLLGRTSALRDLGVGAGGGMSMERLQQMELGRLEDLERRRQQLAALSGFSGMSGAPRPNEVVSTAERLQETSKNSGGSAPATKVNGADGPPVSTSAQDVQHAKDDPRKAPGKVIVPCRARGMPMDHNFKTAYFVISEDTKHGEDLVCSYFSCRNGGVKFRYCGHCMAPVAKRNFCRRHDHGMSDKLPPQDEEDDEESIEDRNGDIKATNQTKSKASSLDILSKAATSSMAVGQIKSKIESAEGTKKLMEAPQESGEADLEDDDDVEADLSHVSKKRRKEWSALLVKRPRSKDPRHLSSWLNEVLAVSDYDAEEVGSEKSSAKKAKSTDLLAKKEKKVTGEKKKRKSTEEKGETKPKKSSADSKPKEKKAKKSQSTDENGIPSVDSESQGMKAELPEESTKNELVENIEEGEVKAVSDNEAAEDTNASVDDTEGDAVKDTVPEEDSAKNSAPKSCEKEDDDDDDEGFAGSFADWRDRKKEKAKKAAISLKN